ncbi:MAG: ferric reductase-like transmembrane domain-containing protein [Candidatus Micrarchaeota archaeon]
MQKSSFLFLLIIIAVALIGAYQPLETSSGITGFIRFFALSSYFLICVSLVLGPLALFWPQTFGQTIEPRRAIGISAFAFALLHMLILVARVDGNVALLLNGIDAVVSITAAIILLVLTLTSSDYAVRTLGPGLWKNIQRFNYLAFVLVTVHFLLKANGLRLDGLNISEAVLLVFGIATIFIQLAGFMERKARMKAAQRQ